MMKYIIALLIAQFSSQSHAMKDYLKDGTVFVAIKNGRIYEFSSNDWKVVKRYKDGPDLGREVTKERIMEFFDVEAEEADPLPPKVIFQEIVVEKRVIDRKPKTHTLIAHFGGANEKYVVKEQDRQVILREEYEIAFGVTYLYNFKNDWSFGATAINRTTALNLGYTFE